MQVSVVVPLYNEEDNVQPLVDELAAVADRLSGFEAVFVDDGSSDATWERIQECESAHAFVRGLRGDGNRGQSAAMLMGLRASRGDVLVTMDGDRQNNPADIPQLVEALSDCDAVCGYRAKRADRWSKRIASRWANRIRNHYTQDGIRDTGCSLKAFRRECLADLPSLDGVHRFMPAHFKLHGRKVKEVPVDHRPRTAGDSKYTNLSRLPRTVYDLVGFVWYRKRYLGETAGSEPKE